MSPSLPHICDSCEKNEIKVHIYTLCLLLRHPDLQSKRIVLSKEAGFHFLPFVIPEVSSQASVAGMQGITTDDSGVPHALHVLGELGQ